MASFNANFDDIIIDRDENKPDTEISHDKVLLKKSFKNSSDINVPVILNLERNESAGMRKLFDMAGLLLRAFNSKLGGLIILDEVDSNFHPALLIKLISIFNTKSINKCNVQLLFSSHDTNLLDPSIMRRDQFYFTEKREDNSTRLYSLADLKGIRNDADFAKHYLSGLYGALPVLEDFFSENLNQENATLGD